MCGAMVTLGCVAAITILVLSEIKSFLIAMPSTNVGVDDGVDGWTLPDQIPVRIYMTFGHLDCDSLQLELDATRSDFEPLNSVVFRTPTPAELDWTGTEDAADPKTACTLDGHLTIGKVSAHFQVEVPTPKTTSLASLSRSIERRRHLNVSHKVHTLHFGEHRLRDTITPLDGVVNAHDEPGQHHYLMKLIPTVLASSPSSAHTTNQYSLAEHFVKFDPAIPVNPLSSAASVGVFFYYDFFPVTIQLVNKRQSLPDFFVSICAIVGGVFALSSILDGIIFRSSKAFSTKHD